MTLPKNHLIIPMLAVLVVLPWLSAVVRNAAAQVKLPATVIAADGTDSRAAQEPGQRRLTQAPSASQAEVEPDVKAYRAALRLSDPQQRIDALEQFLNDFPNSRYAAAVPNLILDLLIEGGAGQKEKILAQAKRIVDAAPEGDKSRICNFIASKLANADSLLDEAEFYVNRALSSLKESQYLDSQRQVYSSRGQKPPPDDYLLKGFYATRATYLVTLGQVYLKKGRDAEAERAFKEANKANPSLITAVTGLATLFAKAGDQSRALEILSEAALSGRMTPAARQQFEELYRRTHQNSLAGLEEMLDAQYLKTFPNPLHVKSYKPRSARTDRLVLAELFTGAGCPPCVAADLAFDAVLERYERRDVAVLVYHQHIPRPDPMANAATQDRAAFYEVRGVPHLRVDGQVGGGGGSREQAGAVYERINPRIERRLETPNRAEIKLEAALDDGQVKVRAMVGKVMSDSPALRLHIALAENKLRYSGENGVRFHPMVVRSLAGTNASGFRLNTEPSKTFEYAFDLARITDDLKAQLDDYEQKNSGFKFSEKKQGINAVNLSVVAFVQDETTLEILQASYLAVRPGSMQLKALRPVLAVKPGASSSDGPKIESPITWSVKPELPARPLQPGDAFSVKLTARIAEGWHFYALEQATGGPPLVIFTRPWVISKNG